MTATPNISQPYNLIPAFDKVAGRKKVFLNEQGIGKGRNAMLKGAAEQQ